MSPALQLEQNKHILEELHESMKVFGIKDDQYKVYDFRTRYLPKDSPDVQNEIYLLKKKFNPNLVITSSPNALHPDHSTVGKSVMSVFQETSILAYEDVRGNHQQLITHWEEIGAVDLLRKLNALKSYKSQFKRDYFDFRKIENLVSARGLQVGLKFVEGFEHIRTVNRI